MISFSLSSEGDREREREFGEKRERKREKKRHTEINPIPLYPFLLTLFQCLDPFLPSPFKEPHTRFIIPTCFFRVREDGRVRFDYEVSRWRVGLEVGIDLFGR